MAETAEQFANAVEVQWTRDELVKQIEARDESIRADERAKYNDHTAMTPIGAAVAHAARVGVFKYLMVLCSGPGQYIGRPTLLGVANEHNITPAELEPVKVWGPEDVVLKSFDFTQDGIMWRICCGEWCWFAKHGKWEKIDAGTFYYRLDAESIRDRIIKDGNYPKGWGK